MTLAVAAASYHAVEMPVRRGRLPAVEGFVDAGARIGGSAARQPLCWSRAAAVTPSFPATSSTRRRPRTRRTSASDRCGCSSSATPSPFTMAQGLGRQGEAANLSVWNQGQDRLRRTSLGRSRGWPLDEAVSRVQRLAKQGGSRISTSFSRMLQSSWQARETSTTGRRAGDCCRSARRKRTHLPSMNSKAVNVLSSRGATVVLTTPDFERPQPALRSEAPRFDLDRIHRAPTVSTKR